MQNVEVSERLANYIARYAFVHDTGDIDSEFCQPEIAAGRCGCPVGCLDAKGCAECLVKLFRKKMEAER